MCRHCRDDMLFLFEIQSFILSFVVVVFDKLVYEAPKDPTLAGLASFKGWRGLRRHRCEVLKRPFWKGDYGFPLIVRCGWEWERIELKPLYPLAVAVRLGLLPHWKPGKGEMTRGVSYGATVQ